MSRSHRAGGWKAWAIAWAALWVTLGCARHAAEPPARVRFTRHQIQRTSGDCQGSGERCTRIRLAWPEVVTAPNAAARDSIAAFIRATLLAPYDGGAPLASEDIVMARFIDSFRSFIRRHPHAASVPWRFDRTIEPLGDTLGVACLAVTETSFLGGAHSNSRTRLVNFDLENGRVLRRDDLLRADAGLRLDEAGERAFRRVRRLAPGQDLGAAGFWFEGGRFRLNDNLGVTPTGLLFFFNDYEIGPRSLGATSLSLRWDEVAPFVRPDGRLRAKPNAPRVTEQRTRDRPGRAAVTSSGPPPAAVSPALRSPSGTPP